MFFSEEVAQNGIGQTPVTHLDGIPVLDDTGHIFPDLAGRFIRGDGFIFQKGLIMADDKIDVLDMNKSVPVQPGACLVDLGDDQGSLFRGGLDDIHADPQAHIAMLSGEEVWIRATLMGTSPRWNSPGPRKEK